MAKVVALLTATTDEICITSWRLLQTYHPHRHFFGQFVHDGRFWVTPPVVFQDIRKLVAEAADSKRYQLIGEPGAASMAASFVECCAVFDARLVCTVDITVQLLDLRRRMMGGAAGMCSKGWDRLADHGHFWGCADPGRSSRDHARVSVDRSIGCAAASTDSYPVVS